MTGIARFSLVALDCPDPRELADFHGKLTGWPVSHDDTDAGETAVLAIGARKAEHQPGETFRIYLDPVGHPFCLVLDRAMRGA